MTEQEAADFIKWLNFCGLCTTGSCNECLRKLSKDVAISALEEIQQYRAIGNMEECQEAVEKQRERKPVNASPYSSISFYKCPVCGEILDIGKDFCCNCGQHLDWAG